ncbi:MAG: hypothetical protein KF819_10885 [Labilithrix sp.]|nr:hypothetical protein [Labilithrix sp.]
MDIFESLEARWFFDDAPPAAVAWLGDAPSEGARVDRYLKTGRFDLGVKARGAAGRPVMFETKYRLGSLDGIALAEGVVGSLERWRKLSIATDDPLLEKHGAWLAVAKDRRARRYAWRDGVVTRAGDERLDAGCAVELTRLDFEIDGVARVAWTFGLEAFGPSEGLLDVLMDVSRAVFVGAGMSLSGERAASYAAWVEQTLDPR